MKRFEDSKLRRSISWKQQFTVYSTKITAVRRELKAWGANFFLAKTDLAHGIAVRNSEAAGCSGHVYMYQ